MKTEWCELAGDMVLLETARKPAMVLGGVTKLNSGDYGAMSTTKGKLGIFPNKDEARLAVEKAER
jgi:hypothetical protein